MGSHTDRIVVLVDMDCFYCQVEEKLDPSLVGKPIAVAQYNTWKGGGLIAVNYPARDKGVTRHMRGDEAKEKCPDIILVRVPTVRGKADLTKYREGGKRVAEVLQTFTPLLQRASIDEAYLDITEAVEERLQTIGREVTKQDLPCTYILGWDSPEAYIENVYKNDFNNGHNLRLLIGGVIVEEIRAAVYEKTGYRCSAGVGHNKILAKLVCGINKPNKQTLLPHESVEELYKTLPIKKIKSLGGKFGNTLAEDLKIKYMSELAQFSEKELQKRYDDKTANFLFNIARGINNEPVEVRLVSKSIGCCKRFAGKTALITAEDVIHWLSELAEELSERLEQDIQENNRKAKQIVLSFAQEVNKKDVHSSRTIALNSYEAKKITEDAFETLKRYTQKADGSFVIKFLGLSAGKFETMKNVNEITSFFKNINKSDTGDLANQNKNSEKIDKNPTDIASLLKNMTPKLNDKVNGESVMEKKSNNSNSLKALLLNINKNTKRAAKSEENGVFSAHNSNDPTVPCNDSNEPLNGVNFDNFHTRSDAVNKNRGILNYFDKNLDPSQNFNSKVQVPKSKKVKLSSLTNFLVEKPSIIEAHKKTMISECQSIDKENVLNYSNLEEELNLSDIENDAENLSDNKVDEILLNQSTYHEGNFSDSTIEEDYSEILATKLEFPHYDKQNSNLEMKSNLEPDQGNNDEVSRKKSPVLGNGGTGNSFFMRYLKKLETKVESTPDSSKESKNDNSSDQSVTVAKNDCIEPIQVLDTPLESVPGSSKEFLSNLDSLNGPEPVAGSSKQVVENYDESNDSSLESLGHQSDTSVPVEVVYSQNSNCGSNFDDSNVVVCSDCGETVSKDLIVSHMDHHLALKLMDEEKKLFKEELELVRQKKINKSPTAKELVKTHYKNLKSTKSVKRKIENNTNITSFFVQKTENVADTKICEECGKNIGISDYSSHLDFHAAKKLHLELNPVKVVTKNQFSTQKVVNKKSNSKNINVNNNISVANFFKPK